MSATTTNSPPAKGEYPEGGRGFLPKLRFPEFLTAAAWSKKAIGPYLVDCSGRVASDTDLPIYSSTREGLKRQDAYFDGQVLQNKNDYGVVPAECFVYRHMSDDGLFKFNINRTGGDIAVSKEYPVFKAKGINSKFLLVQLNDGLDFKRYAYSQKAGGTRTRLYFSRLCEWQTPLPSIAEQQKIAACLSSLDELIAAQARKVEALKTHKKGLMQQIFPREGENKPRFRFPEFQNDSDWEEKRVDELGDVLAGKALAATAPGPLRPYLRTKNVLDGEINLSDVLTMPMTDAEFSRFEVLNGDVLLNEGQTLELVGRASIYRGEFEGRCAMQNQLIRFRAFPSTCREFAAQTFRKCQKDGTFARIATQTTSVAHLGSSRFSALTLLWPPSLHEQQHIASCLSGVDVLITTEIQELDTLKTHKKGLMQQLFPAMDEMRA